MRNIILFIIGFVLLGCKKSNEEESYKIYNEVLKEKVSTYGINLNYLKFPNDLSVREINAKLKLISDSLKKSKSLSFYLDDKQEIIDTLNPTNEKLGTDLIVNFEPRISKSKIDFKKIVQPKFAKRINRQLPIDENANNPVYLGEYRLSVPIFINDTNAVIKYEHYCGGKCGVGILIYLKKIKSEWVIVKEKEIYIS